MRRSLAVGLSFLLMLLAAGLGTAVEADGSACLTCAGGQCQIDDFGRCSCDGDRQVVGGLVGNRCRTFGASCVLGIGCDFTPVPMVAAGSGIQNAYPKRPLVGFVLWALGADDRALPQNHEGSFSLQEPNGVLLFSYRYELKTRLVSQPEGAVRVFSEAVFTEESTGEVFEAMAMFEAGKWRGEALIAWPAGAEELFRWQR